MRIALCCLDASQKDGANRLASVVASSLQERGFSVACASLKPPVKGKSFKEFLNIKRWYISRPTPFLPLLYRQYIDLNRALKKCEKDFEPDCVINASPISDAAVLRKIKASKVLFVHALFEYWVFQDALFKNKRLYSPVLNAHYTTLTKLDRIVCNSQYMNKRVKELWGVFLPFKKIDIIYPFIKWKNFQKSMKNGREKKVCCLGRVASNKGIELVIRAFLRANIQGSKLVIGGSTSGTGDPSGQYYRRLQVMLKHLNDPRIELIGDPSGLDPSDIADILCSSRCFAMFNPFEAFGLCAVEALAAGTPPIVADAGGQRETVVHGLDGFLVGKENALDEMADYMRILLTDEKIFKDMSEHAREDSKRFDEHVIVEKWVSLVNELARNRSTSKEP